MSNGSCFLPFPISNELDLSWQLKRAIADRFTFQKSGLKSPTSVGKDFNCAPQAL